MPRRASWGHASLCSNVISQNPANIHTQGGNYFALLHMNMDIHMSGISDMLLVSKTSRNLFVKKCENVIGSVIE